MSGQIADNHRHGKFSTLLTIIENNCSRKLLRVLDLNGEH